MLEPRPVVIFGPLKDKLTDELIKSNEALFQQAIPHTTRPMRNNEVEGRDYYFVTKDEMTGNVVLQTTKTYHTVIRGCFRG